MKMKIDTHRSVRLSLAPYSRLSLSLSLFLFRSFEQSDGYRLLGFKSEAAKKFKSLFISPQLSTHRASWQIDPQKTDEIRKSAGVGGGGRENARGEKSVEMCEKFCWLRQLQWSERRGNRVAQLWYIPPSICSPFSNWFEAARSQHPVFRGVGLFGNFNAIRKVRGWNSITNCSEKALITGMRKAKPAYA